MNGSMHRMGDRQDGFMAARIVNYEALHRACLRKGSFRGDVYAHNPDDGCNYLLATNQYLSNGKYGQILWWPYCENSLNPKPVVVTLVQGKEYVF